MTVDRDTLVSAPVDVETAEVEVPGKGVVVVRGLTRAEVFWSRKGDGDEALERRILSCGIVEPELSQADIATWYRVASAGEMDPVLRRIQELSGLAGDASKSGAAEAEEGT